MIQIDWTPLRISKGYQPLGVLPDALCGQMKHLVLDLSLEMKINKDQFPF